MTKLTNNIQTEQFNDETTLWKINLIEMLYSTVYTKICKLIILILLILNFLHCYLLLKKDTSLYMSEQKHDDGC